MIYGVIIFAAKTYGYTEGRREGGAGGSRAPGPGTLEGTRRFELKYKISYKYILID